MPGFRCGTCNKLHDHLPRDIGYRRPDVYLTIPEEERARRAYETDDLCVIDGKTHLIRGVLYLPIKGGEERFGWGVWVLVSEADYNRYLDAWDDDTEDAVPPFVGRLSNRLPPYPDADGVEVMVKLRSGGSRPLFTVRSVEHPLGMDQRDGITPEKAHSFVAHFV
jgi:hypothetical protein